ncbi:DNA internalization-related competence protein ComEC/Rec2 [hydrothermal vent metagenome]|uniref:DNA internalization-related competence protein ComEC/Rec2 n=1 Tax=hydrothermal vent metagenome TaxID=652676 RepID=A0A3B1B5S8_9ZZZZ
MISAIITFTAGILVLQSQPELPNVVWGWLVPFCLSFLIIQRLRIPMCFCLGFLWAMLHGQWMLTSELEPSLEGKDVRIEGLVVSLPEQDGRRTRFLFEVEKLELEGKAYSSPGKVRLGWYQEAPELIVGERWQLLARLKRPHGFMNPGGFDYAGWLFQEDIRATGYVRAASLNERLTESTAVFVLQRLRQNIRSKLFNTVPNHAVAAILVALVIGDRSGLERDQWQVFTRTGTNHLIAISGLHIGIIAGLAFFIVRWLWSRHTRLSLWLPTPQAAAIGALVAALFYAAMAGFAVPTQRALIMLSVVMGGLLLRHQQRPSQGMAIALLVVVLVDPLAVLSAGFWLSFAAVAVILFGISGRVSNDSLWQKWGQVQWVVAVGLMPILVAWGMQVSLLAPVVNLVAVPLFTLLIVPTALLGSMLLLVSDALGGPLLWPIAWLLDSGIKLLALIADWPFASWNQSGISHLAWLSAGVGVLLLLAPSGLPGRWLGGIFLLPMLFVQPKTPESGEVWFSLLDVGQGLSAVIRTQHHTLVFDAGARFSKNFNAGSAVVAPFLREMGVNYVDRLVLSNADNDHAGGGLSLSQQIMVQQVVSGESDEIDWAAALPCNDRMQWEWDGVRFSFLHPTPQGGWRGNNASCVLLVENAAGRILLPGDIEKEVEAWLVQNAPKHLAADLVQVPHHGSMTSSTTAFVQAVSPEYALVPVGYRNRYRFPRPEVVRRWQAEGATVLETSEHGAISFRLHPNEGISGPHIYRESARRYWMD